MKNAGEAEGQSARSENGAQSCGKTGKAGKADR